MQQDTYIPKGSVIILSSPSGGGKSSITRELIKLDSKFTQSISVTTRPIRPGEVNGKDYHFISTEEFNRLEQQEAFLEKAVIYGNQYGTLRQSVETDLSMGYDVIFDIDWQGAVVLKAKLPNALSIFILPPSIETLKKRLVKRGQDSIEIIEKRISLAQEEIDHAEDYDYKIINEDLNSAVSEIYRIILKKRQAS
jgi:guanylate kinase